jgi:3-hydroxyisobutyrate dehydrogenase-like beta-hydroxyacid dehydrogenase
VAKIAFLGMGMMGTLMATRLVEAGHELTVWNRTLEKTASLAERGARVADTPAHAAEGVDVAITMLTDPQALEQVLFAEHGLSDGLVPGQLLIDMSTVGPEKDREVAGRLAEGVAFVDAPVRGSTPQAASGELQIYVGGSAEDFERAQPILSVLGTPKHIGDVGSGAAMKLVVNLALCASMAAVGESLSLGEALGIDRATLLDVLGASPVGPTITAKRSNLETDHFPPAFKLGLADKDLGLVARAATDAGRDLRVSAATRQWFDEAMERGDGDLDFSAVVAVIKGERAEG